MAENLVIITNAKHSIGFLYLENAQKENKIFFSLHKQNEIF